MPYPPPPPKSTSDGSTLAKIRPRAKIDNFASNNINIIIEEII